MVDSRGALPNTATIRPLKVITLLLLILLRMMVRVFHEGSGWSATPTHVLLVNDLVVGVAAGQQERHRLLLARLVDLANDLVEVAICSRVDPCLLHIQVCLVFPIALRYLVEVLLVSVPAAEPAKFFPLGVFRPVLLHLGWALH